jgi:general stress protein YciG
MSGTIAGGRKAAKTNKKLHGADFYARIGAKGGRNGHTGGFASNPALARVAGAKGGKKSRRTGVKNGQGKKAENKSLLSKLFGGK